MARRRFSAAMMTTRRRRMKRNHLILKYWGWTKLALFHSRVSRRRFFNTVLWLFFSTKIIKSFLKLSSNCKIAFKRFVYRCTKRVFGLLCCVSPLEYLKSSSTAAIHFFFCCAKPLLYPANSLIDVNFPIVVVLIYRSKLRTTVKAARREISGFCNQISILDELEGLSHERKTRRDDG